MQVSPFLQIVVIHCFIDLEPQKDKKLFTPGPLGVSFETKKAMLRDYGSHDTEFIKCVRFIRTRLLEIAGVPPQEFAAIPLQGSGHYAVESVLTTTTPRHGGKVFIMEGGAYGKRLKTICDVAGLDSVCVYLLAQVWCCSNSQSYK